MTLQRSFIVTKILMGPERFISFGKTVVRQCCLPPLAVMAQWPYSIGKDNYRIVSSCKACVRASPGTVKVICSALSRQILRKWIYGIRIHIKSKSLTLAYGIHWVALFGQKMHRIWPLLRLAEIWQFTIIKHQSKSKNGGLCTCTNLADTFVDAYQYWANIQSVSHVVHGQVETFWR